MLAYHFQSLRAIVYFTDAKPCMLQHSTQFQPRRARMADEQH
jgi:hypothetical protein